MTIIKKGSIKQSDIKVDIITKNDAKVICKNCGNEQTVTTNESETVCSKCKSLIKN